MTENKDQVFEVMLASGKAANPFVASVSDYNRACWHVLSLLRDSVLLLRAGSSARAAFLAICALEETAKVTFGPFVDRDSDTLRRRGVLHSHPKKQILGAGPLPLELRQRLVDILGKDEAERVLESAWSGELTRLREASIYFAVSDGRLLVPEDGVSEQHARSIVIFAIDNFDDAIVGLTNESFEIGRAAEALLSELGVKV